LGIAWAGIFAYQTPFPKPNQQQLSTELTGIEDRIAASRQPSQFRSLSKIY